MAFAGGIGALFSVVGSVVGAMGAMQQGRAAAASAEYNARLQEIQAKTATRQAAFAAGNKERENRQRLAAGRAGAMESGLELSGSINDVLNQTEDSGHLDFLTQIYEGEVKATGYRNNANLYRMEADAARTQGAIGAATNLLGGLSSVFRGTGSSTLSLG